MSEEAASGMGSDSFAGKHKPSHEYSICGSRNRIRNNSVVITYLQRSMADAL